MSRYIIAPEAVQDLDEISNYFLLRNVEVGERWFQAFSQKC
jgi:toxin ParE1/3/4